MCAFIHDLLLHSGQTVEDDGACATLDIVYRRLRDGDGDGTGNDPAEDGAREGGHGGVRVRGRGRERRRGCGRGRRGAVDCDAASSMALMFESEGAVIERRTDHYPLIRRFPLPRR